MTSDHRVAGSSPAGCKSSLVAYLQAISHKKKASSRAITCQSFATFEANPLSRPAHPREQRQLGRRPIKDIIERPLIS